VLSTLHTTDATQTVNRVITFFPPHQHQEIRYLLAATIQAVICQRLLPRADGNGMVPAVEVMVTTGTIRDCIITPEKTPLIVQFIREGVVQHKMQAFDQSLMDLYQKGLVTLDEALRASSNPHELMMRLKGIHATSDKSWDNFEGAQKESAAAR
jgi:twitching motility protein PilT